MLIEITSPPWGAAGAKEKQHHDEHYDNSTTYAVRATEG
jgi:hypothetical protein